ncbi:MAG: endonuclease III [Sphaerochaetaceae bacterium]
MKKELVLRGKTLPSVSSIAKEKNDPFTVLISTLISLRTKDSVTIKSSRQLFTLADTPEKMVRLNQKQIEQAIYPAGFFQRKSKNILEIAHIILERYQGKVPCSQASLMELPGVGIKTANLTLSLGFGIQAICVDCHVHQIANRLGWVHTKTPEETEKELQKIMPKKHWIPLNELLVAYGQEICTPISPWCSLCPESGHCPKIGVAKQR